MKTTSAKHGLVIWDLFGGFEDFSIQLRLGSLVGETLRIHQYYLSRLKTTLPPPTDLSWSWIAKARNAHCDKKMKLQVSRYDVAMLGPPARGFHLRPKHLVHRAQSVTLGMYYGDTPLPHTIITEVKTTEHNKVAYCCSLGLGSGSGLGGWEEVSQLQRTWHVGYWVRFLAAPAAEAVHHTRGPPPPPGCVTSSTRLVQTRYTSCWWRLMMWYVGVSIIQQWIWQYIGWMIFMTPHIFEYKIWILKDSIDTII